MTERTEVLIVGAGPTGLTAAVRLAQLGIPHVVLDARDGPTETSNAALVHASTIELLAELGIGDELVAAGRRIDHIIMVDRGRPLVRLGFGGLPTRYPFALGVPQNITEALLLKRLADLGGEVRRGRRVELATCGVDARYVIGADGSHSTIRESAGIAFRGATYESSFVLADIALHTEFDEATINLSPDGVTVLAQLPSGTYRVVATVAEAPPTPDRSFIEDLLRRRGIPAQTQEEPVWSSRFRIHHRVADRFRTGSIFLAGDAAHVHSPAAGQGMNTGIADAFDLATRLAAGRPSALDGYEAQRRVAALEVVRFTDRMTRMAMLRNPIARTARRLVLGTAGRSATVQRRIGMWVSGLERSPLRRSDGTAIDDGR
jgi:2-polyprenyl-6-methoxyphenol hydroxylase-like FAD-dependent oxidoreductase